MKKVLLVIGTVLIIFSPAAKVAAGSLNTYENEVIAAANQTYEYNGVKYQVDPSFISQLVEYLSSDGVDLTLEQRDEVMQTAFANLEQGITGGYLVPVPGQAPPASGNGGSQGSTEDPQKEPVGDKDKADVVPTPKVESNTSGNLDSDNTQGGTSSSDGTKGGNSSSSDIKEGKSAGDSSESDVALGEEGKGKSTSGDEGKGTSTSSDTREGDLISDDATVSKGNVNTKEEAQYSDELKKNKGDTAVSTGDARNGAQSTSNRASTNAELSTMSPSTDQADRSKGQGTVEGSKGSDLQESVGDEDKGAESGLLKDHNASEANYDKDLTNPVNTEATTSVEGNFMDGDPIIDTEIIKETGFNFSNTLIILMGMGLVMLAGVYVIIKSDLFAQRHER